MRSSLRGFLFDLQLLSSVFANFQAFGVFWSFCLVVWLHSFLSEPGLHEDVRPLELETQFVSNTLLSSFLPSLYFVDSSWRIQEHSSHPTLDVWWF